MANKNDWVFYHFSRALYAYHIGETLAAKSYMDNAMYWSTKEKMRWGWQICEDGKWGWI